MALINGERSSGVEPENRKPYCGYGKWKVTRDSQIAMSKVYTIEEHQHRFAAWAAATAASASPLCRFKVAQGVRILEEAGFDIKFSTPDKLPTPKQFDAVHLKWRNKVISVAKKKGLTFKHGVAAKLINCYLKVRFVCGVYSKHNKVQHLHPPIDRVLLDGLARSGIGVKSDWLRMKKKAWSKFESSDYQDVIDMIKSAYRGQPLWKVEEFWKGHR